MVKDKIELGEMINECVCNCFNQECTRDKTDLRPGNSRIMTEQRGETGRVQEAVAKHTKV